MIPIAFYLVYVLAVLFCAGSIGRRLLQALATVLFPSLSQKEAEGDVSDTLLLGLVVVTTLTSAVSLVHPIDLKVHVALSILVLAGGGRYLWRFIKRLFAARLKQWQWPLLALLAACLGCMVFVATNTTTHHDTGLYHAQMIKWNTEFGVVPGLANLHARLGFNSAWDLFASFLDQSYFGGRAFHIVNLLIGVIFLLACFRGLQQWLDGSRSIGTIFRCVGIAVILRGYRSLLPSLSNDWPIELLLYYLVILTVEWAEQRSATNGSIAAGTMWKAGLAAAACAFAVTIKLSSAPIVLLLLLFLWFAPNKTRTAMLMLIPAICVAVPFLARNVVLTGYLIFPSSALDLFGFDWKMPRVDVEFCSSLLRYWAIDPAIDWYRAADMTLWDQFHTLVEGRADKIVRIIPWFCIGLAAWIGVSAQAKIRRRSDFYYCSAICGLLLAGIAFCFVKVPDPRFARGWFLAFGLFPLAWLCHAAAGSLNVSRRTSRMAAYLFVVGCSLWMIRNAGVKRFLHNTGGTLWNVADLPLAEAKEVRSEYGVLVKIPVRDNCLWNAALPNTPYLNRWLEMRGATLKQGFRVTKPAFPEWLQERETDKITPSHL